MVLDVDYEERMIKFVDDCLMPVIVAPEIDIYPALRVWRDWIFRKTHYKAIKQRLINPVRPDNIWNSQDYKLYTDTINENLVLIKPFAMYGFYCPKKTFTINDVAPIYFKD